MVKYCKVPVMKPNPASHWSPTVMCGILLSPVYDYSAEIMPKVELLKRDYVDPKLPPLTSTL